MRSTRTLTLRAALALLLPELAFSQCPCLTYCTPSIGSACTAQGIIREHIGHITYPGISNTTCVVAPYLCPPGHTGYSDFRSHSATVALGQPNNITVIVCNPFNSSDMVSVFVDWNGNGVFDVPAESTNLSLTATGTTFTYKGTLTAPLSAVAKTVMRVALNWLSFPSPCAVGYGEVEDYSVTVLGGKAVEYELNKPNAYLAIDGVVGTPYQAATTNRVAPTSINVQLGGKAGAVWALGFVGSGVISKSAGAYVNPCGGIWGLDLNDPSFIAVGGTGLGPFQQPVPVGVRMTFGAQLIVHDPSACGGYVLSQPAKVVVM